MNKKLLAYISTLTMLIPVPGRFAYGILLVIVFNLVLISGTLFLDVVKKFANNNLQTVIMAAFLIGVSVFIRGIFIFLFPVIVLQLGVLLYFPALSVFVISAMHNKEEKDLKANLMQNIASGSIYSLLALLFMFFRDILGYGCISIPVLNGIAEIRFINTAKIPVMCFFASLPGTITLSTVAVVVFIHILKKIEIMEHAGVINDK
jgi:hypothetical protein